MNLSGKHLEGWKVTKWIKWIKWDSIAIDSIEEKQPQKNNFISHNIKEKWFLNSPSKKYFSFM